jgi:hypothetical protein
MDNRQINWGFFKLWIVIVHNFPLNNARQSIHICETEHEAQSKVDSWAKSNVKAYAVETTLIQLLNTMASSGEFSHLSWVYPPTTNETAPK